MNNLKAKPFIFLFIVFALSASNCKAHPAISRPEFFWVLTHPFVAKKSLRVSQEVLRTTLQLKKEKSLDTLISGGNLDAFKHTYWMACLSAKIGIRKALKLGKAHEKGNYLQYKKHKKEEGQVPDSVSSVMDLWNNVLGAEIYLVNKTKNTDTLKTKVLEAIKIGKAKVIKTNANHQFLDCENKIIDMQAYQGKWNVPKCLINSGKFFGHRFF
jgi:hypothetical protein